MSSSNKLPSTIRRATPADIESILNLLTDYGLPRSYFEPFYLNDTSYLPQQSWVVEQQGRLISHLRVYDRWIYIGSAKVHIAGIGNVITAPDARGSGHAGRLIRAMLPVIQQEGYAYSLLWTHLLDMYSRFGWVAIEQELVRALLPTSVLSSAQLTPFQHTDLAAVMQLYERTNAERTGAIIRSPEYWREQPTWLHEDLDDFLVARDLAEGALVGYLRSRMAQHSVEILELGFEGDRLDIGRELLTATSLRRDGQLQGQIPPSLRAVFLPGEFGVVTEPGLMGRVLKLEALLQSLVPVWQERIRAGGISEGILHLSTSSGPAVIQVVAGQLQIHPGQHAKTTPALHEREFTHLLFHGLDEHGQALLGERPDIMLLQVLFPVQNFGIWQADAF